VKTKAEEHGYEPYDRRYQDREYRRHWQERPVKHDGPSPDLDIESRIAEIQQESRLDQYPEKDWSFYNKDHLKNRPKPNPHRLSYADIIGHSRQDLYTPRVPHRDTRDPRDMRDMKE